MEEVRVRTANGEYPVFVGSRLYEGGFIEILRRVSPRRVVVVSHPTIYELHGKRLEGAVDAALGTHARSSLFLFDQGEENKNLETLARGYSSLLEKEINREDLLVAFGGGVVGDLAGFIAATYMRGMSYIQVPTTLMAMVDSSIGGKVGVDLPGAKNAVGSFYQPLAVYADVEVLETLPARELRSGMAEVAKYGFLYDAALLDALEAWEQSARDEEGALAGMVFICAGHKARVVGSDERDLSGVRAILNYGHTFGHALESASGFGTLRHGEAVAVGMMMAARLSELSGLARQGLYDDHRRILVPLLADAAIPSSTDAEALVTHMRSDKKKGERNRFVLLVEPQTARLVEEVPQELAAEAAKLTIDDLRGEGLWP